MNDRDVGIVQRILRHIDHALLHKGGMDYAAFSQNITAASACAFEIMQIGELASLLSDEIQNRNPDIPWKNIRGMRNRLVHDYENINLMVLWDTVNTDLPELKRQMERLNSGFIFNVPL